MSHCHHFQQGGKDELDPAYLCLHSIKESSPKCTSCPTLAEAVPRGQAYLSPFKSPSLSFHFSLFSWDNGKEGRNSQHPHLQSFYQPQQALSWTPHESASQTRDCTGGLPLSPDAILQANLLLTGSFLHGSCFSQINLCRLQMALWGSLPWCTDYREVQPGEKNAPWKFKCVCSPNAFLILGPLPLAHMK